jgi:citronellol/citronellal dehydrogenase
MSLCVLGMHEELRDDGIAANALWPRTMIWTAAVANVINDGDTKQVTKNHSRSPEIMADSAYLILQKPSRQFTGQFLVDDTFLATEGLKPKDFLQYSYDPSK